MVAELLSFFAGPLECSGAGFISTSEAGRSNKLNKTFSESANSQLNALQSPRVSTLNTTAQYLTNTIPCRIDVVPFFG